MQFRLIVVALVGTLEDNNFISGLWGEVKILWLIEWSNGRKVEINLGILQNSKKILKAWLNRWMELAGVHIHLKF